MLCQLCKKQPATVHLTEVVEGEKRERHMCDQCAAQEGVMGKSQEPVNELVAKFVLAQASARDVAQLTCPECGMTFLQFRNSGLLGCPNDYHVFEKPLLGLLERAHGGRTQHVGKVPGGKENKHKRQHELMILKPDLQRAVDAEDYERAAVLRDKIRKLEQL
jgi:protein arginine kinase activator